MFNFFRFREIVRARYKSVAAGTFFLLTTAICLQVRGKEISPPIRFTLASLPFRLEVDETVTRHLPATMAGGVAVFDFDRDGRPDIFFTNGADIATLKKSSAKFQNRLFRSEGNGVFKDVTAISGLTGIGYDEGVAAGDFDNDGYPDLFVTGVHRNTLYHNNGNGTFTDVTEHAGIVSSGTEWAVAAAWVDVNNDGLLDLFVANYAQWDFTKEPVCAYRGVSDYCAPTFYQGLASRLYLNKGAGRFEDVSEQWGVRSHVGRAMGIGVADYDGDGLPDLFVTNDSGFNFLFHNRKTRFEEIAFEAGVALVEDGNYISGMGVDLRDFDNDGYPDLAFVALAKQTFPLFRNLRNQQFQEITVPAGMRAQSIAHSGFGAGLFDLDNDGWKDLFVTAGHVLSIPKLHEQIDEYNLVFRNGGPVERWQLLTEEDGLTAGGAARNRGCAFGDFDGDGRIDVVTTAIGRPAALWLNRGQTAHWIDVALEGTSSNRDGIGARLKLIAKGGTQFNHQTTSVGYASSSDGPVHFGLGQDARADSIEVRWPSGIVQTVRDVAADQVLKLREPAR